jgi:hypothetical protein
MLPCQTAELRAALTAGGAECDVLWHENKDMQASLVNDVHDMWQMQANAGVCTLNFTGILSPHYRDVSQWHKW